MRKAALLLLLASPVAAQDADPANQMIEGYVACLMARGDAEVVSPNLGLYGWTTEPPVEGIITAFPGVGGDTFLLMSEDRSFCHVESLVIGTRRLAELLGYGLPGTGFTVPEPTTNDQGCLTYDFGQGILATLTAGGENPACTSDTTSTLLFTFAPAD